MATQIRLIIGFSLLLLAGCAKLNIQPTPPLPAKPVVQEQPSCSCPSPGILVPEKPPTEIKPSEGVSVPDYGLLKPADWSELDGVAKDNLEQAWDAWMLGCGVLKNKPAWQEVCTVASSLNNPRKSEILAYFKEHFSVYRATNMDGSSSGLITGYYEPVIRGSREKKNQFQYPLYTRPDDLLTVDLASVYPELANKRVRGRLVGNKVIPYFTRGEIDSELSPLVGRELLWGDDPIEIFFLQIQGSGMVKFDNGEKLHIGYADQNGQAYQSIGRLLIDRGEISADKASMQGIKDWGKRNPGKLKEILNANPSYVFFRELPPGLPGPLGALGTPILPERVVAVDTHFVPLGAPVFLSTTYPNSNKSLARLMMAQDTGGAIKGGVRADFFWGPGIEAGKQAGAMKQSGKIWVLLPKDFQFPKPGQIQSQLK
jgi:membrane-bound lytic murein transglycosylase A